jgi:hypothetical protein
VLDALIDARSLVLTWSLRGARHIHRAEDVRWIGGLLGPRFARAAPGRERQLGIDGRGIDPPARPRSTCCDAPPSRGRSASSRSPMATRAMCCSTTGCRRRLRRRRLRRPPSSLAASCSGMLRRPRRSSPHGRDCRGRSRMVPGRRSSTAWSRSTRREGGLGSRGRAAVSFGGGEASSRRPVAGRVGPAPVGLRRPRPGRGGEACPGG